ncbi:DNA repair and recombination protein RadB [Candidatus Woesearchaeota archaeon]|nr:DNA repair and recombination protein RadB [Candidatus Woesearchaeota archaeon]MBW3013806.1 DNA repair and recombination protein RadB [Candidatus Woesearchaeota archaeon]
MGRISAGTSVMDDFLGGYETDIITTIYGPSASGKTNLCLLAAIRAAKNKKVIYVDTEGGFSVERVKQITNEYERVLRNIHVLRPTTFEEQTKAMNKLRKMIDNKIGLIVIDTISMLYRLELGGDGEDVYDINRAMGRQIAMLSEIARKKDIPVLCSNQVYADFENKDKVNMVGGDLLKYGSKCLIELQKTPGGNCRAIIKKHRSMPVEKEVLFKIVEKGIEKTKEGKGFRFF